MLKLMRILLSVAATILFVQIVIGQPLAKSSAVGAYLVPFASEDNHLELTVVSTEVPAKQYVVRLQEAPTWVDVVPMEIALDAMQTLAAFSFAVAESAPVGEVADLAFTVLHAGQPIAEKVITIEVDVPKELTLKGNYPNPFGPGAGQHPTTKIGFTLPEGAAVQIRIYNSLGQEIVQLIDRDFGPGYPCHRLESSRATERGVFLSVRSHWARWKQKHPAGKDDPSEIIRGRIRSITGC